MHPGPMNRGVEIDSAVADGERSVILPQVTFGIAVRMAVMSIIAAATDMKIADQANGRLVDPAQADVDRVGVRSTSPAGKIAGDRRGAGRLARRTA